MVLRTLTTTYVTRVTITLGEVTNVIDGLTGYTAELNDSGNSSEHSYNMPNVASQDIKTNPYQMQAYDDDYVMLSTVAPDSANDIKFHQTRQGCIPNMDVKSNYAQ